MPHRLTLSHYRERELYYQKVFLRVRYFVLSVLGWGGGFREGGGVRATGGIIRGTDYHNFTIYLSDVITNITHLGNTKHSKDGFYGARRS